MYLEIDLENKDGHHKSTRIRSIYAKYGLILSIFSAELTIDFEFSQ